MQSHKDSSAYSCNKKTAFVLDEATEWHCFHRREGFAWSWLNELYGSVTRQNRKHFLCYEKKKKFRPTALRTFCRAVATLLYKSKKVWEKSGRTYAQNHALLLKTKMHTHKTFLSSLREGGGRGGIERICSDVIKTCSEGTRWQLQMTHLIFSSTQLREGNILYTTGQLGSYCY